MFCFPQSWQSHLKLLTQRGNRALGLPRARQFYCNTWLEMPALITYAPWLLQILFIRADVLFTNWTLLTTIIVLSWGMPLMFSSSKTTSSNSHCKILQQWTREGCTECVVTQESGPNSSTRSSYRLSLISTNGRNPLTRSCRGRWTCKTC